MTIIRRRVLSIGCALTLAAGLAACYSPKLGNGDLECGPTGQCPGGYTCGADNHCYSSGGPSFDAAREFDAAPPDIDATVQPPAPASSREITGGSGRVSGGSFSMDVQVGHPMNQRPATGGGKSIEGASAIKP